jgi:hypothetical protein
MVLETFSGLLRKIVGKIIDSTWGRVLVAYCTEKLGFHSFFVLVVGLYDTAAMQAYCILTRPK